MGVIKPIPTICELKLGQVYCLLDGDSWLLKNGVGNRMRVRMGYCVEKRAGLTQMGDIYCDAGSVFEVLGGLIGM